MNFLRIFTPGPFGSGRKNSRSFPNGIAKVHFIFELTNFFQTFLKNFLTYFFIDAITS